MFLGVVGFIMIFVIVYCLIQSKANPIPIFITVPLLAAFVCGFAPEAVFGFVKKGVTTTWSTAVLFLFSIVYFGLMSDVGMFDPLVNFLVKKAGSNIILITVATAIIATIAHLDGTTAGTMLITVPAMLPIYKSLHMRPVILTCLVSAAIGVMNLTPWGGPTARVGIILNTDVNGLWQELIPVQIAGFVMVIAFAVYLGVLEKRRGAGVIATGKAALLSEDMEGVESAADGGDLDAMKRPKLLWFNVFLTAGVILLMCFTKIPLYGAFMIGLALALLVNFRTAKEQANAIKVHASAALSTPMILLTTGVFLGVLNGTKMMEAMANILINVVPSFLGPHLAIVLGMLSVPIGMMLGTDSFFFGFLPLAIGVADKFGVSAHDVSMAMLIGKDFCILVTPHNATTFLLIGLAGISIKEQLKFCTPYLWLLSWIMLVLALVLGIFAL